MVGKTFRAKKESKLRQHGRITALIGVSSLVVAGITVRLFMLQVNDHDYYTALAQDQHTLIQELVPSRGQVYVKDTNGELFPLAVNRELYLIYAVPNIIKDPVDATKKVADILHIPTPEQVAANPVPVPEKPAKPLTPQEKAAALRKEQDAQGVILYANANDEAVPLTYERLQQKLSNKQDKYEPLANRITKDKADALVAADIPGIRVVGQEWRYYPENSFAAQTLGFIGYKNDTLVGQYGIEGYFDDLLTGKKGVLEGERDTSGNWISIGNKKITPAEDGASVVLTLDRSIQYAAEKYAKMATQEDQAEEASIIVIEPKTGNILGMANYPTYNVNEFSDAQAKDPSVFNNSVVFDLFEPGSIFKPIVMASAIDAGVVTPSTTFDNTGSVKIGRYTISNVVKRSQRITTMTEVLDWSLNTGMVFVTQQLGKEKLYDYIKRFGFDELTGITLDSESKTNIGNPQTWSDVQQGTIGFGQGISTTELHMAMAESALANGGKLMEPHIVSEIRHPDGRVETIAPKVVGQPISAQTSETITAMLIDGVKNGLSKKAAIPGYLVAGKTGTAQVAKNGVYDPSQRITSFMGYAPATNPRFLILVKVVNPKHGQYAETTAIPYFQRLATEVINSLKIPPDNAQ